jgi:RNA polymerase sigma-70 factor (ECF subfamily)
MEARKYRSRPQGISLSNDLSESLVGSEDVGGEWDGELEEALSALDEEQQHIVALRYYADLKLEEIAAMTGTPLGTVKSRLHRALGALRARLLAEMANTQEGNIR